jgi:hypothetical protein
MLRSYHKKVREFKKFYSKAELDKLIGVAHQQTTDLKKLQEYIYSSILKSPGGKISTLIIDVIPNITESIKHHK